MGNWTEIGPWIDPGLRSPSARAHVIPVQTLSDALSCRRQGTRPNPEVGHVLELVRGTPASARSARRCALSRRPCETDCYRALPVGWKPVRTLPPLGAAIPLMSITTLVIHIWAICRPGWERGPLLMEPRTRLGRRAQLARCLGGARMPGRGPALLTPRHRGEIGSVVAV